ncbi:MAG: hypothetical protein WBH44_09625 [Proteocatella sp.]
MNKHDLSDNYTNNSDAKISVDVEAPLNYDNSQVQSMSAGELEQLASALLEKENELSKKEEDLKKKEAEYVNYKEKAYDKINISVKTLDKIIVILFVALIAAIFIGMFKAQLP